MRWTRWGAEAKPRRTGPRAEGKAWLSDGRLRALFDELPEVTVAVHEVIPAPQPAG